MRQRDTPPPSPRSYSNSSFTVNLRLDAVQILITLQPLHLSHFNLLTPAIIPEYFPTMRINKPLSRVIYEHDSIRVIQLWNIKPNTLIH